MTGELRLFDDEFEPNVTATPAPTPAPSPAGPHPTGLAPHNDAADESETDHADSVDHANPFTVVVERSKKRKRTVGAELVGDLLTIVVPSWMSRAEEEHWVDVMSGRFRRKVSTDRIDLDERAVTLARRHDLPRPREIRWSDDMLARWGSCTPTTGTIRISSRIARFPDWVIDYVLVHELAHLEVSDHSDEFWKLANRYPKAERAIGYLIAKSGEETE